MFQIFHQNIHIHIKDISYYICSSEKCQRRQTCQQKMKCSAQHTILFIHVALHWQVIKALHIHSQHVCAVLKLTRISTCTTWDCQKQHIMPWHCPELMIEWWYYPIKQTPVTYLLASRNWHEGLNDIKASIVYWS